MGSARIPRGPTPAYASYLNRIECHFGPISEFVVKSADYLDWDAFVHAPARYITYRKGSHRDQRLIELERQIAAWHAVPDQNFRGRVLADPVCSSVEANTLNAPAGVWR